MRRLAILLTILMMSHLVSASPEITVSLNLERKLADFDLGINGGEISPDSIDWSKFSGTKKPFQQYARRHVFDRYYGSQVEPAYLEVKEYERLERMDKWVRRKQKLKNPFNKFYANVRGIAGDQHMGKVKPKLRKYVEQVQERLRQKDEKFGVTIHAEESAKMATMMDKKKKKKKTATKT